MKRPKPDGADGDAFDFVVSNGHAFRAEPIGEPKSFAEEDTLLFVVHFRPALTEAQAVTTRLRVTYAGDAEVGNKTVFNQLVWPAGQQVAAGQQLTLRPDRELEYVCFETHQLKLGQAKGTFCALYLGIENRQCDQGPMLLCTQLDMHHTCMPTLLPDSQFLRWFPPDVDPKQWGLRLDPRNIPQRTPLWIRYRNELAAVLSGSSSVKVTGFFANSRPIDARARLAMRRGSQSEDVGLLGYLDYYERVVGEHRTFQEIGLCPVAGRPGWAVSPDGIIYAAGVKWSDLPATSPGHRGNPEAWDVGKGVVEFKTSSKLCMEDYFYPQLYMEMLATNTLWADLVRYRPTRTWNAQTASWEYQDVMHVYREYRDATLEADLIHVWTLSPTSETAAAEKAAMRKRLKAMAAAAQPIAVIDASKSALVARYREHRRALELATIKRETPSEEAPSALPTWWLDIERHTQQLAEQLRNGQGVDRRLVATQIKAYASLLL